MSLKKLIVPIGIGLGMGAAYTPWGERLSETATGLAVQYRLLPESAMPVKTVAATPTRLRQDSSAGPQKIGEGSAAERDYIAFIARMRFDDNSKVGTPMEIGHAPAGPASLELQASGEPMLVAPEAAQVEMGEGVVIGGVAADLGAGARAVPAMGAELRPGAGPPNSGPGPSSHPAARPVASSRQDPGRSPAASATQRPLAVPAPGSPQAASAQACRICTPGDPLGLAAEGCLALAAAEPETAGRSSL